MSTCDQNNHRGSSEPLSLGQKPNYTSEVTYTCSPLARRQSDRAAGLAVTNRGEGSPAQSTCGSTKDARPVALPFDLAAVLCGHDPTDPAGASDARHDYRVWDLVGGAR